MGLASAIFRISGNTDLAILLFIQFDSAGVRILCAALIYLAGMLSSPF